MTRVRLTPAALDAVGTYVTDPAFTEDDGPEGEIAREIEAAITGRDLEVPPERADAWADAITEGSNSADGSRDHAWARALANLSGAVRRAGSKSC